MKKKITVKDLQNFKGKKQLTLILVKNKEEALAAEKVGVEMVGERSPDTLTVTQTEKRRKSEMEIAPESPHMCPLFGGFHFAKSCTIRKK